MTSLIRAFRLGLLNMDFVRQVLSKDLKSGFVVGIIALPMSVGIALASGFPPFAGLVASLIGGLVVSFISGSRLCIKGPAGGLSAITLSSVLILGNGNLALGYQITLAVIVVSGGLQIISSLAKMGSLGDFFPAAVIHGMLAGLGFIMAVKQLPPTLGMGDNQVTLISLLKDAPALLSNINPKVALVGLMSLLILYAHQLLPKNFSKSIPAVVLMLLVTIPLGVVLNFGQAHTYTFMSKTFEMDPGNYLVSFPQDFLSTLARPNFQFIALPNFWIFCLIFSLAGNIESLLTCKAVDQIDPWHRQSDFNQDLMAIGVGNVISGLCGGLPMISESKRSVVNIQMGGSTFASNFFHALFLLLFILFAQPFIRLIPISALAAFLIFTGIRMTMPKEFSKSYQIGKEQFAIFFVVFAFTITSNLLYGVIAGTFLELIVNMRFGATSSSLFESNMTLLGRSSHQYEAFINGPATFSNFLWVKKELEEVPANASITFNFSKATIVDHSFMENLEHFEILRRSKGGNIVLEGLDYHSQVSTHPLAARRMITTNVSPRQTELQGFCDYHALEFDKRRLSNPIKYDVFDLDSKLWLSYVENQIQWTQSTIQYEMADLHCEINGVTKYSFTSTILTAGNLPETYPDFILLTEGFERTLLKIEQGEDINFSEYPAFSYYYYLAGGNEIAIRQRFTSSVIRFLEQHKGYHLRWKAGNLLAYKRTGILNPKEMEKLSHFVHEFISLLTTQKAT